MPNEVKPLLSLKFKIPKQTSKKTLKGEAPSFEILLNPSKKLGLMRYINRNFYISMQNLSSFIIGNIHLKKKRMPKCILLQWSFN
jgi:hypothetical protein